MEETKFKVAILTYETEYSDEHYAAAKIVEKYVTEWSEVNKEELDLLTQNLPRMGSSYGYRHLVVLDESRKVPRLVEEALSLAKKEAEKKEKRKKALTVKKQTKTKSKLEEKKKLFNQLKIELRE